MKTLHPGVALLCLTAGFALEVCCIANLWHGNLQSIAPTAADCCMHGSASLLIAFSLTALLARSRDGLSGTLFFFFLLTAFMAPVAGALCVCLISLILGTTGYARQHKSLFITGNPLLHAVSVNSSEEPLHEPLVRLMAGLNADRLSSMILGIKNHIHLAGCRALLARCRQHENPLVQLHAQAALARDEEARERMRMRVGACLENDPENYFANRAMAELCLATAQRYAGSPGNARPHLETALRHIKAAQKNRPADVHLLSLEAKCHSGLRDSAALRSTCFLLRTADSSGRFASGAELALAFSERRWEDVAGRAGACTGHTPSCREVQAFWQRQERRD